MELKKSELVNVLRLLSDGRELFVPGLSGGIKQYVLWQGGMPLLDGENTLLPPKDILFPKTEKMYSYRGGKSAGIQEIVSAPRRVIFGLRPCDIHSIKCMDMVFTGEGQTDSFYARRREGCLLIGMSCPQAGENCFCEAMGLDPNSSGGADIFLTDGGGSYSAAAYSSRGAAELERWKPFLRDGEQAVSHTHCSLAPGMSEELSRWLLEHFDDDELWLGSSQACLGCGVCSFVCPSCYCFDIENDGGPSQGTAFRCWDSCMFSDYNQNAGGHNPRPTKKERLRNRYLHKLVFFSQRHGVSLCTGCGRCISKCPAHLDIAGFIEKASEVCHDRA